MFLLGCYKYMVCVRAGTVFHVSYCKVSDSHVNHKKNAFLFGAPSPLCARLGPPGRSASVSLSPLPVPFPLVSRPPPADKKWCGGLAYPFFCANFASYTFRWSDRHGIHLSPLLLSVHADIVHTNDCKYQELAPPRDVRPTYALVDVSPAACFVFGRCAHAVALMPHCGQGKMWAITYATLYLKATNIFT